MEMYVIDTSITAKWFLPEPLGEEADHLLDDLKSDSLRLAAPDLLHYEFAGILWRKQVVDEISARTAAAMIEDLERLPLEMVPADVITTDAVRIACKYGCTSGDGVFLALAAGLGTSLITADRRLIKNMEGTEFKRRLLWLGDFWI